MEAAAEESAPVGVRIYLHPPAAHRHHVAYRRHRSSADGEILHDIGIPTRRHAALLLLLLLCCNEGQRREGSHEMKGSY